MHIEHITHDQCRKPTSAVKKAKYFLASHIRRLSQDQKVSPRRGTTSERPVTLWPAVEVDTSKGHHERDTKVCETLGNSYSAPKNITAKESEGLKNMRSFSIRRRKSHVESGERTQEGTKTGCGEGKRPTFNKIRKLGKGIGEEKLERVAPHTKTIFPERWSSPSVSVRPSRHSSSSRTKEIFGTGEDLDFASKFQPPFTHHRYPLCNLSRRNSHAGIPASETSSRHSISSDIHPSQREGIPWQQRNNPESAILNIKGKNLWRAGPLDPCRLCKTRNVEGIRGLCRECENDFAGPEIRFLNSAASSMYEFEEEIKPTPPLKDRKTLALRKKGPEHISPGHRNGESTCGNEDYQGTVPEREGEYENGNRYTVPIESEYEKAQKTLREWREQHDSSKFGLSSQGSSLTANTGRKYEDDENKQTSLYSFGTMF